jgi:hypothetical protein
MRATTSSTSVGPDPIVEMISASGEGSMVTSPRSICARRTICSWRCLSPLDSACRAASGCRWSAGARLGCDCLNASTTFAGCSMRSWGLYGRIPPDPDVVARPDGTGPRSVPSAHRARPTNPKTLKRGSLHWMIGNPSNHGMVASSWSNIRPEVWLEY